MPRLDIVTCHLLFECDTLPVEMSLLLYNIDSS